MVLFRTAAARAAFVAGQWVARRTATTSWYGGLLSEPTPMRFGVVKIILTMTPGLYIGAFTAKTLAEWMEETELFVPDDDDDD